jgi:hypothetical protein
MAASMTLLVSMAPPARAITWGSVVPITDSGKADARPGAIVQFGNNGLGFVYQEIVNDEWRIFFRRSTDGGTMWEPRVRLSATSVPMSIFPRLASARSAMDAVWISRNVSGSVSRIVYARSLDRGVTWGEKLTLSPAGQSARSPSVARDGAGRVAVTWTDATTGQIKVRVSTDGGSTFGWTKSLATSDRFDAYPSVAISGKKIHVAYYLTQSTLAYRNSRSHGLSWSDAKKITGGGYAFLPHVAASGSTVMVGYVRFAPSSGDYWSAYRRSTDGGVTWKGEKALSAQSEMDSFWPVISRDGGIWRTAFARCLDTDCLTSGVYVRESTDGGAAWSPATQVSPPEHEAPNPVGVKAPGGKTVVAWVDYRSGGISDLYVRQEE